MSKPITAGPFAAQRPQRAKWEGTREGGEAVGGEAGMRGGYDRVGRVGRGEMRGMAGVCLD